jgi:hypothetical protein
MINKGGHLGFPGCKQLLPQLFRLQQARRFAAPLQHYIRWQLQAGASQNCHDASPHICPAFNL